MTVSVWWLVGEAVWLLIGAAIAGRISYFWGIRDGAFNHHLPIVRREMLVYNKAGAKEIFADEDGPVHPVTFRSTSFNGG